MDNPTITIEEKEENNDDIESEIKSFSDKSKDLITTGFRVEDLMSIGFTVEDIKRMYNEMIEDRLENRIKKLIKHNYNNCLLRITDKED